MKQIQFTAAGALFGIMLYKSEAISWFRIQEMFRFDSFRMYGILGSAVAVAALCLRLMKRAHAHSLTGEAVAITGKPLTKGTVIGGLMFGLGWALTGACPGPLYVHVGAGTTVMVVAIVMALVGAWTYALLRPRLPH